MVTTISPNTTDLQGIYIGIAIFTNGTTDLNPNNLSSQKYVKEDTMIILVREELWIHYYLHDNRLL